VTRVRSATWASRTGGVIAVEFQDRTLAQLIGGRMQMRELQGPGPRTGQVVPKKFGVDRSTGRPRWKRVASALASCAVAGSLMGTAACDRKHAAAAAPAQVVTVGVAKVARQELVRRIVLTAEFRPFQEIDLHAKVAGFVKVINVDVGDIVKQGQLIATLEIPELQHELVQATAAVKRSEHDIRRAQGELENAQSVYAASHAG